MSAAYIRPSHHGEAEVTETAQREAVARLAQRNGDTITQVYGDWGRSGISKPHELAGDTLDEMLAHRRDMLRPLDDVREGRVDRVYVYDQDRVACDEVALGIILHRVFQHHSVKAWDQSGEMTDPRPSPRRLDARRHGCRGGPEANLPQRGHEPDPEEARRRHGPATLRLEERRGPPDRALLLQAHRLVAA